MKNAEFRMQNSELLHSTSLRSQGEKKRGTTTLTRRENNAECKMQNAKCKMGTPLTRRGGGG